MAVSSHNKVSRKALKQPDEFISTLDWIGDLVAGNLARVIIGAVAIVAAIVIVSAASFYSQYRQRIASEQFYRAINALSNKDYPSAEKGFSALAQNESGRKLGHLARFYLATTYLAQNQTSKARDTLRNYLAMGGSGLFQQMALTQLGVVDEDLSDYQGAHAAYVKAAQLNGPEKARAQVGAARTLALIGDRQGAINAYQQFLRENPFAQQRAEVIEALAQMGAPPEPAVKGIGSPAAGATTNTTGGH
ncbi:MAG: tetratricopeptide repeat protein [Deltaproteobacteria bacterium]|nr:tetratricopeptide repeat protein [Deltaproteobacteria bacterium]MBV8451675.1 tetratricopeptide repeat protein [Deltaproteobacteria bacterium]